MICILASSRREAEMFANSQEWDKDEWFCPLVRAEIEKHRNFHTLIIGTYWDHPVPVFAEDMYRLAKIYGYKGR